MIIIINNNIIIAGVPNDFRSGGWFHGVAAKSLLAPVAAVGSVAAVAAARAGGHARAIRVQPAVAIDLRHAA